MAIIFLQPIFQESIWGGNALQKWFPDVKLGEKIGEACLISANPTAGSIVESGVYKGMSLNALYQKKPELFGYPSDDKFPLLIKILDAQADVDLQVHPNAAYVENTGAHRPQDECWYVLDAAVKTKIILGHRAQTAKEFTKQVKKKNWGKLLIETAIKKDDFFYIPSGTVRALGAGALVLDIQTSPPITDRLVDSEGKDVKNGKHELQLNQAFAAVSIPHQPQKLERQIFEFGKNNIITLIDNDNFTVKKLHIREPFDYKRVTHYVLGVVIAGAGTINDEPLVKGSSFIIPSTVSDVLFEGAFDAIISFVN